MGSKVPGVEGQPGYYELGRRFWSRVEGLGSRKFTEAQQELSDVTEEASTDADLARGHIVIGHHACEAIPTGVNIGQFKSAAKMMAKTIGVRAVYAEEVYQSLPLIGHGGTVENAQLGADMLNMYLDQTCDSKVVKRIEEAVKVSETYKNLGNFVAKQVGGNTDAAKPPSDIQLKVLVQKALDLARKPKKQGGMDFYFGGEGLQPVIGGVTGLTVSSCHIETPANSMKTAKDVKYACQIIIQDTYDFDNDRTIEDPKTGIRRPTKYSIFRDELAELLRQGKYCEFERKYNKALDDAPVLGGDWDHMNKGHMFASYMYALEKAGFFHGIPWSITEPMTGSFSGPGSVAPAKGPGTRF